MSQPSEPFPMSQLDHTRYNFRNANSVGKILDFAEGFVEWLRSKPPKSDALKAKIDAFVNLITANGDAEVARDVFHQVSLQVPELRSNHSVTDRNASAMDYFLFLTRHYRPQARQELPPDAVYFTRSVARQLDTLGQTQRESRTEENLMQAVLSSLAVQGQSGSSSTAQQPLVVRKTPQSGRSNQSPGSPGTGSPGGSQMQSRPQHHRTTSGTGTSGRREEAESGSLQDLRNRRTSTGAAAGSSPQSSASGLVQGVSALRIHHDPSTDTSTAPRGLSGTFTSSRDNRDPRITPLSPSKISGAQHIGLQDPRSPSDSRGRSNTMQPSTGGYGPSAYTTPRREPSQSRGQSPQAQGQASVDRGRSSSVAGSGHSSAQRTPGSTRPPPSAMSAPMSAFQASATPRERGRSGTRQPDQQSTRDASTGSTGTVRLFAPRPIGETAQRSTSVSRLRYPPGQPSSQQPGQASIFQAGPPQIQSGYPQQATSRSGPQQPISRGNLNIGTSPMQSGYPQQASPSSDSPNVQQNRGRTQSRPPPAGNYGPTSGNRAPSSGQGRQSSTAPTNRAPSVGQGRQSSNAPGTRAPSASQGRSSSNAPTNRAPPAAGQGQSKLSSFFSKKDSSK